jgi:transcriptional regulator with XRE-family HTH domain
MNQQERITDFNQADKPEEVKSYHIAVMNCIMHLTLPSNISQESLARRAGCSQQEVSQVFSDFAEWKWLSIKSGKRHQNTNWILEILFEHLPTYVPRPKMVIGKEALDLTTLYKQNWPMWARGVDSRGYPKVKKLPPNWQKRWSYIFQLRIEQGYTFKEMYDRMCLLGVKPEWNRHFRVGPQNRKLFPIKKEAR